VKQRNAIIVQLIRVAHGSVISMTNNKENRQDWAQGAILRALEEYDKYKQLEEAELLKTMKRIIVNRLVDQAREGARHGAVVSDVSVDMALMPSDEPEPLESIMVEEMVNLVLPELDSNSQTWLRRKWSEVKEGDCGDYNRKGNADSDIEKTTLWRIRKKVRKQLNVLAQFEDLPISGAGPLRPSGFFYCPRPSPERLLPPALGTPAVMLRAV